jgi:hypothetical protein
MSDAIACRAGDAENTLRIAVSDPVTNMPAANASGTIAHDTGGTSTSLQGEAAHKATAVDSEVPDTIVVPTSVAKSGHALPRCKFTMPLRPSRRECDTGGPAHLLQEGATASASSNACITQAASSSSAVGLPDARASCKDVAKPELGSRRCKFVMPPRPWQPAVGPHRPAAMQNVAIAPCSDRIDRRTLQKLPQSVRMDVSKLKEAHEAAEAAMCVHQATPTQILRLLALLPDKVAIAAGIPTDALQQATESAHATVSFSPRDLASYRFKIHKFLTDMRFGAGAQVRARRAFLAAERVKGASTAGEPDPASGDSDEETETDSN